MTRNDNIRRRNKEKNRLKSKMTFQKQNENQENQQFQEKKEIGDQEDEMRKTYLDTVEEDIDKSQNQAREKRHASWSNHSTILARKYKMRNYLKQVDQHANKILTIPQQTKSHLNNEKNITENMKTTKTLILQQKMSETLGSSILKLLVLVLTIWLVNLDAKNIVQACAITAKDNLHLVQYVAASKDPSKIETLKIDYNDLDFTDPACVTLGVTSSNVIMKVIIPGIQNQLYFVMNEDEVIKNKILCQNDKDSCDIQIKTGIMGLQLPNPKESVDITLQLLQNTLNQFGSIQLTIKTTDCESNTIKARSNNLYLPKQVTLNTEFIFGKLLLSQFFFPTSIQQCTFKKFEITEQTGSSLAINDQLTLNYPYQTLGTYTFSLKVTSINGASTTFSNLVLKVVNCAGVTLSIPMTQFDVPKIDDDFVYSGVRDFRNGLQRTVNFGKSWIFDFPFETISTTIPGCQFFGIGINKGYPELKQKQGTFQIDNNTPQDHFIVARGNTFKPQIMYQGGQVQTIQMRLNYYTLEAEVTGNSTVDIIASLNVKDCSLENVVISDGTQVSQILLTTTEFTMVPIDDWFIFSKPFCSAKGYMVQGPPPNIVKYLPRQVYFDSACDGNYPNTVSTQYLRIRTNTQSTLQFQLTVTAHGGVQKTVQKSIEVVQTITDNACQGQTVMAGNLPSPYYVFQTVAPSTTYVLNDAFIFSNLLPKCVKVESVELYGLHFQQGKLATEQIEDQFKLIFKSDTPAILHYNFKFTFEKSLPYNYTGQIIIQPNPCAVQNSITVVPGQKYLFELPQQQIVSQINLENYFRSTIPNCLMEFELQKIDGGPLNSLLVYLQGERISISQKIEYNLSFKIQVKLPEANILKKQEIQVKVTKPNVQSFAAKIFNKPPTFQKMPLIYNMKLDFVIGTDGIPEDLSDIEFTSPKAIDPENDPIKMEFDSKGKSFISTRKNDDNTFTLKLKRSLIFDKVSSEIPVKITLMDDKASKTVYQINVIVNVVDKSKGNDKQDVTKHQDEKKDQGDSKSLNTLPQMKEMQKNEFKEQNSISRDEKPPIIKTKREEEKKIQEKDINFEGLDLSKDQINQLKKSFQTRGPAANIQNMPVLTNQQREKVQIAMVVLEKFKDVSEMSDEELKNEEFIGQKVDMRNFDNLIYKSEDRDSSFGNKEKIDLKKQNDQQGEGKVEESVKDGKVEAKNEQKELSVEEKELARKEAQLKAQREESIQEAQESIKNREIEKRKSQNAEQNLRLRKSGVLSRTRSGYVFKGIDPKLIELAAKKRAIQTQDIQIEKTVIPEGPKMGVEPLNPDGSVGVTFNQPMLAPEGKIDQCMYSVAFEFNVQSNNDGSKTSTDFCSGKKRILNSIGEKIEGEADKMSFIPAVISHSPTKITMNMTFSDPEFMSIGGTAQMSMVIKETSLFKSQETLESMTKDSFEKGQPELSGGLPPQIADKELAQNLEENTNKAGNFMQIMQQSNFLIALILSGSMGVIWGMIRALQMISLSAVIEVKIPNHLFMFLEGCIVFAQMDIFDGGETFEKLFKFKYTDPINDNFAFFQISDRNFVLNSGSYFVIQIGLLSYHFVYAFISIIAKCNSNKRVARQIGIKVYSRNHLEDFGIESMKLYLESYFDLVICAFINLDAFLMTKDSQELRQYFFTSNDDIFCSALAIFYSVLIFSFPIFGFKLVSFYQDQFQDPDVPKVVSVFVDGVRTDTFHRSMYNLYFLGRRFLTASILVWLRNSPFFQCIFLMILSTINFIYLIVSKPLLSKTEQRLEIFNELCILLCSHIFQIFLNAAVEPQFRNLSGWAFIAVAVFNIAVNLLFTIFGSIVDVFSSFKNNWTGKKSNKIILERISNRRILIEKAPGAFLYFQYEVELYDSIQFCKEWFKHRKWLQQNDVDFSKFEDHKRYLEIQKKFMLEQRVRQVTCTKGMIIVAEKLAKAEMAKKMLKNALIKDVHKTMALQSNPKWQNSKIGLLAALQKDSVLKRRTQQKLQANIVAKAKKPIMSVIVEVTENSEVSLIDVDQQDDSSSSDGEMKEPEKIKIVSVNQKLEIKDQLRKIKESNLFLGFKPLNDFFDLRHNKDRENLSSLKVKQLAKKDETFAKAVEIEIQGFKQNGQFTENQQNQNQVFNAQLSLEFFKEYDENLTNIENNIYDHMTKTSQQKLMDFNTINGNWPLINGGENDAVQAVVQCLVSTEVAVKHILKEVYNKEKRKKQYQANKLVSTTLNKVFSDMWRQDLRVSRKAVDISFATRCLGKWFNPHQKHDAAKMLRFVIQMMIEEEIQLKISEKMADPRGRSDSDVEKYYNSSKLNKMFEVLMTRKQQCKNNHQTSQKVTSIGFEFEQSDRNIELNILLKNYLNITPAKQKCKKCKSIGISYYGHQQLVLECLPQILIFNVDNFNKDGSLHHPDITIDKQINMMNFLKLNKGVVIDPNLKTKYELIAIVSSKNKQLNDSNYYTLIRKGLKGERYKSWFSYNGQEEREVTDSIARTKFPPQILIYKLLTKEESIKLE